MSKVRWFVAAFVILAWRMPILASQPVAVPQKSPDSEFQAAVRHYNSGQYQQAVRELEAVIEQVPSSFEAHELLGLSYAAESKDAEAHPHFEKAVLLKPNSSEARANLAVNLARLGKKRLAEAEFKKAIAISPRDYETNHDFGEFYAHEGKIVEAIPYLETAQRAMPSSIGNGYDLALAYEKTSQFDAARRELHDLIRRNDAAELHNLLAEVEEKSGNYLAAASEYQRAAQMDPSETNLFDWGSAFLLHQTCEAAIAVFSQGVRRYPNSSPLAVGLGMAFYWNAEFEPAVKALVGAADIAPSDPHP